MLFSEDPHGGLNQLSKTIADFGLIGLPDFTAKAEAKPAAEFRPRLKPQANMIFRHGSRAGRRRQRSLEFNDYEGQKQLCRLLKTAAGPEPDLGRYACSMNNLSLSEASCLVYVDHQQNYSSHERLCSIAQGKEDKISV
jgi:hypothetical protein